VRGVREQSIANIAERAPKSIPVSVNDWTDCLVLLQQGQVDAISTDDTIWPAGQAGSDTKWSGTVHQGAVRLAMKKKPPTSPALSTVSARMREDGTWASIYTRWLSEPAQTAPAACTRIDRVNPARPLGRDEADQLLPVSALL